MANGFINNDFNADGDVAGSTGTITNYLTANSFDGAYSVGVPGGWVSNLGLVYAGGTLGVRGSTTTLSATNTAYLIINDKTNFGRQNKYTLTVEQSFGDSTGTSTIIGNLFGLTTSVAYAQDIPFYLYAVVNDDEDAIAFMCSRVPGMFTSPGAANIGMPSSAVADNQYSFFSFKDVTAGDYDTNPCLMIGSFRMRMNVSDDWTVQALDSADGIGKFNDSRKFTFPTGVFGASSGTYFKANGGTAPLFTTNEYYYTVSADGIVRANINLRDDPGTDGAGAVNCQVTVPYNSYSSGSNDTNAGMLSVVGSGVAASFQMVNVEDAGGNYFQILNAGHAAAVQNADFGNGARRVCGFYNYQIAQS